MQIIITHYYCNILLRCCNVQNEILSTNTFAREQAHNTLQFI